MLICYIWRLQLLTSCQRFFRRRLVKTRDMLSDQIGLHLPAFFEVDRLYEGFPWICHLYRDGDRDDLESWILEAKSFWVILFSVVFSFAAVMMMLNFNRTDNNLTRGSFSPL